jgi:hypothetical protein
MAAPVRPRQISLRAHFDQTRGGAFEFLNLESFAGTIKRFGFGLRRRDELDRVIVEGVDQDDEALGEIAPVVIHHRNVVEHERVEFMCDLEVVGGGEGLFA